MTKQYSKFHLPWLRDAKCAQDPDSLPEAFGDDEDPDELSTASAEAFRDFHCLSCPVMVECLRHAVVNKETLGVWGGTLPSERENLVDGAGILEYRNR